MTEAQQGREPTFWAAPQLAKAGYPVFPIWNKIPSVEGGFYAATTDVSRVADWITEGREHHDVAFATGLPSQVVVVDADTPEAYADMARRHGTPHVKTKRGGHWYFRHPQDGKVTSRSIASGLDCKGDGGYVVAPPSRGRTWTNGIPDRDALPPSGRAKAKDCRASQRARGWAARRRGLPLSRIRGHRSARDQDLGRKAP
jgi:hypothetical protein